MLKYPIGVQTFEEIRTDGYVYVGKTDYVYRLADEELLEYFRAVLLGFYSVLKSQDDKLGFAFLTGVTKIGKLSVFSGLNNLKDISMLPAYSGICGITEGELMERLSEGISDMAALNGITSEECLDRLKEMYDGYHFSASAEGVYNPFSLLNTLQDKEFNDYWFETGTPSFLVSLIKNTSYDISALQGEEVDSSLLVSVNSAFANDGRRIFRIGVNFSTATRRIEDWKIEQCIKTKAI